MSVFSRQLQVRWSDIDANFHVRHSVYYDWGAFCRVEFLTTNGLTMQLMHQLGIGFILFREECVFRREILLADSVSINLRLVKARKDFSRMTIQHQILKDDGTVAAVLTVDGAWINVKERKLSTPPEHVQEVFRQVDKGDAFEWQ